MGNAFRKKSEPEDASAQPANDANLKTKEESKKSRTDSVKRKRRRSFFGKNKKEITEKDLKIDITETNVEIEIESEEGATNKGDVDVSDSEGKLLQANEFYEDDDNCLRPSSPSSNTKGPAVSLDQLSNLQLKKTNSPFLRSFNGPSFHNIPPTPPPQELKPKFQNVNSESDNFNEVAAVVVNKPPVPKPRRSLAKRKESKNSKSKNNDKDKYQISSNEGNMRLAEQQQQQQQQKSSSIKRRTTFH